MEKLVRIFATTVPAFFAREKPISRKAKPACMKNTSAPATMTHRELIATESGRAPFLAASSASACAAAGKASSNPHARRSVRLMARKPADALVPGHCPPVEDLAGEDRPAVEAPALCEKNG